MQDTSTSPLPSIDNIINWLKDPNTYTAVVVVVVTTIIIWFVGRIIKMFVKRTSRIPPDAKNGIRLIINLLQISIWFLTLAAFSIADPGDLLASTAVLATAIGFASTTVATNIVGGFYIIITRPFGVGDFIQVKGTSGVVLEIGLSYTRMLQIDKTIVTVPNSNLISANLLNSNISVEKERKKQEERKKLKISTDVSIAIPDLLSSSMQSFKQEEIVRFSTLVQLKLNQYSPPLSVKDVKERLDMVCEKFEPIFGFKPIFYFGNHVFRQDTHFVITAKDTNTLLSNYPDFMDAIMKSVFKELQ
jgi:hypothetical protein